MVHFSFFWNQKKQFKSSRNKKYYKRLITNFVKERFNI
ncbi:hypothetical protein NC99_32640 [Sunxiuqinia dokdonensis]|uniref:Uncharacterized protein n=1 Tax=Sunxiuqinia dokdonensis TaxID=1409788 RepID=A0A0L8V5Y8_9BACT|nr:hypothetical protein NC99_32640 [Sunxiuqinia dokdonensis]